MSGTLDPSIGDLNDCGCCAGLEAQTPKLVTNRPGLPAISNRVGVHAQFKASMLAQLSTAGATLNLKTREDDDFSIALLDAWGALLDVLTFYQERIANECYLRTALERRSVLELARLIGYQLRPGVAATADLAFTLDDAAGTPESVPIEIGTRVQSVPGPNETAQTFQTIERIVARPAWNAIRPRMSRRHVITGGEDPLLFDGTTINLKPGDGLLITPDDASVPPQFRRVATVTPQPSAGFTSAALQAQGSSRSTLQRIELGFAFFPGPIARRLLDIKPVFGAAELKARGEIFGFAPREVFKNLAATQPPPPSVLAFRVRAAIFGNNAPSFSALTDAVQKAFTGHWVDDIQKDANGNIRVGNSITLDQYPGGLSGTIDLDNVYPGIAPNSFIVLKDGDTTATFQVQDAVEVSKADFTLSLKITRLTLTSSAGLGNFTIRGTTVFAQSEALPLARDVISEPVTGSNIDLDGYVDGLFAGQRIIASGESSDSRGVEVSESAIISDVTHYLADATRNLDTDGYTSIALSGLLSNSYVRTSFRINGNVARANHGESTNEVLGAGDASQPYQTFTLRQAPLTFVSSPAAAGGAISTLNVIVNDVQWKEVPTLDGQGPADHVFVTRTGSDDKTTVEFGDGLTGARLPTGQQNVRALYRKGIGLAGMVRAGQLSILMDRPLGVREVTNPQDAQGGEDPESLDGARANASLTVLTLDRIVSLEDYENFARAFAGIAKALATWTWSGQLRGVLVTVGGPGGAAVDPNGPTYSNLLAAMQRFGDPHVPVSLAAYRKALFQVSARLAPAPDRLAEPEPVLDAAEAALRQTFSFAARSFGQPVTLSEVMAVLQDVAGVQAVEVDALYRFGEAPILNSFLPAAVPQPGMNLNQTTAELLTLDPRPVDLGLIT
jgi:predicted phage baseplate assembly protein